MNRITKYILSTIAAAVAVCSLAACTDDLHERKTDNLGESVTFNADGTTNVRMTMEIPALFAPSTRSMGEAPDFENLKLYMLVFDEEQGVVQYAQLQSVHSQPDADHGHNALVTFTAILEPTEHNTVIHLIATDQPDFHKNIGLGTEERVITALYTDENHEAYWQRLDLEGNIPGAEDAAVAGSPEAAQIANIARKMSHVPMVRNFCRVSVVLGDRAVNVNRFMLTGLYVLNTVDRGSVAPYVAGNPYGSRFVNYYTPNPAAGSRYQGLSYDQISAQNHIGTLPTGVLLANTSFSPDEIHSKSESPAGNVQPVYFYERPARINSTERTYVIIRGRLNGGNDTYYKLDLGYTVDDGVVGRFEYYNLLRNFDYVIRLSAVESEGYKTLQEAAQGAVFNNFSASIEARNMVSISDGHDMILVSFTSYVFTQPDQTVDLFGQFRTEINNNKGGEVHNELITYYLDSGDVISSISETKDLTTTVNSWNTYTVTGGTPTDQLKQQSVYIYRGNKAAAGQPVEYGLYRVVTFFSHTPWEFKHIDTFPGLWESPDDMPDWNWSNEYREIGQSKGSPLTLFFELPPGLPQALFPLNFVIESDRQNIQNAYQGNAVVQSVPASESLFKENPTIVGTPTTARIQYVKTVTWEDYNGENRDELVGSGSTIVRCRFLTITDLKQDGIGDSDGKSETTLRVANPYFGKYENGKWTMYHQDGFFRDKNTSNPSPRFWDFSSGIWDVLMYQMNVSERAAYTTSTPNNANIVDELMFLDGHTGTGQTSQYGTMSNGLDKIDDNTTLRYVLIPNKYDSMRHSLTYANTQERTIRLSVMSTDAQGNSAPPRITFTNVANGTMTAPNIYDEIDNSGVYPSYVYEILVPQNITAFNLNIMTTDENPSMRFYKIDFYPRWGEFDDVNP